MAGFGAHHIGLFLIFCAFGLMLIVSVGTPIWKKVEFVHSATYNIGTWGYCTSGVCTPKHFGYRITDGTTNIVTHWLTYAVALAQPIAAGVCFLALLFAGFNNLCMGILGSMLSLLAFIFTAVALAFDLGLAIEAKRRINRSMPGENAQLGKAIWFVVAAAAAAFIASFLVCFTHSARGVKSRKAKRNSAAASAYEDPYYAQTNRDTVGSAGLAPRVVDHHTDVEGGRTINEAGSYDNQPMTEGSHHSQTPIVHNNAGTGAGAGSSHFWKKNNDTAIQY